MTPPKTPRKLRNVWQSLVNVIPWLAILYLVYTLYQLIVEFPEKKKGKEETLMEKGKKVVIFINEKVQYGKTPMPSNKPQVASYVDEATYEKIKVLAKKNRRSISQQVSLILEDAVKK